jgi:predicted  nucleic acid-binding Zn-ribbon protein
MAKKIKKVETPIDQHETFVSLQKNFADSEISVEEKLKTLYELQKADSDIDKIMQLRGELPAEVETLEAEVAQMKAKQAQLTAMIDEYNKSIAVNKQNAVDCDDQIAKYRS